MEPTRFLLVRHGQSTWNAIGRWQGRADAPLSPAGEPKLIATRERGAEGETERRSRSMGLDPLAVHERFVADHLDQDRSISAVPDPAPNAIAAQRQRGLELLARSEHDVRLKG